MKLQHVLSRSRETEIDLDRYRADDLKKAARFWVGSEAGKFHKQKSISALTKVFSRRVSAKQVFPQLSEKQKRVLEIFSRYGPVVSGSLLSLEVQQRGLVEPQDDSPKNYYKQLRSDVVNDLREKLVLVSGGYDYYYSSYFDRRYPELTLHPAIATEIEPAPPLSWEPSEPVSKVAPLTARAPAEPALDLWRVAEALREMGNWTTIKGDALSKGSRNKLRKLVPLPSAEVDPLSPPDPESLWYELLREMGCLSVAEEPRMVIRKKLEEHFAVSAVEQAWHWVRAWLDTRLWQDGIGVVPDRDNHYDPVRIEPDDLRNAKELLIWALSRAAHSPVDWLDLEVFLKDLWRSTHKAASSFYWHAYTWDPDFAMARTKDKFPAGQDRSLAFWLDSVGTWTANAVMVTLFTLGLVQRGETGGKQKRPCFRLTDLGRQVFGAPEIVADEHRAAAPFLTVQPNHEILAYLESADARRVCTLSRFARRSTAGGGPVQAFTLSRESVYEGLQSGMTPAEIQGFLAEHGKTELPVNVARALQEWSEKRESLVLRHGVTLALVADAAALEALGGSAESLSQTAAVLKNMSSKTAAKDLPGWMVLDHQAELPRVWTVDELGRLQSRGQDTISSTRLASFADRTADAWLISGKSVSQARTQGFTAEEVLSRLSAHLVHEMPSLLRMAVRNWTGRAGAFSGKVHLLQITRSDACEAVLGSDVFQPLLAGHIPPCWFIVRDGKSAEVKKLLNRLGFQDCAAYQVATLEESRQVAAAPAPKTATKTKPPAVKRRRRRRW